MLGIERSLAISAAFKRAECNQSSQLQHLFTSSQVLNYDNVCKYLAEEYPNAFARWLLPQDTSETVQVLKTELSLEPIRAGSLTLLQAANQILEIEFQTRPKSTPPLPLRMLDYSIRLKRQYNCEVEQVVIFLQRTANQIAFTSEYRDSTTIHRYRVLRMWEQDPDRFLANPALLPLATAQTQCSSNFTRTGSTTSR